MKTLVKYRATCHFESDGIAVRQGDELLCLGPLYVRDTNERSDNRLFRCLPYLYGSQDLFVDVHPFEAEEIVETSQEQRVRLSSGYTARFIPGSEEMW